MIGLRLGRVGVPVAALCVLAIAAPSAAAKQAPLGGQLIGDAAKRGGKIEAPVLLSGQSAKKLGLRSPLATLSLKASKKVPAPNPTGSGKVTVGAETLRSGDRIDGKGKLKGSAKKLMPVVRGSGIEVVERESAYSLDELTAALVALFQRVGALELRVNDLETSLNSQIADLRAEIERLKAKDASLEGQINSVLTQLTTLQTQLQDTIDDLAALTSTVGGLPTDADLLVLQGQINTLSSNLTSGLANLQTQVNALPTNAQMTTAITNAINTLDADLQGQINTLNTTVSGLATDVGLLCTAVPLAGC